MALGRWVLLIIIPVMVLSAVPGALAGEPDGGKITPIADSVMTARPWELITADQTRFLPVT